MVGGVAGLVGGVIGLMGGSATGVGATEGVVATGAASGTASAGLSAHSLATRAPKKSSSCTSRTYSVNTDLSSPYSVHVVARAATLSKTKTRLLKRARFWA